MVLSKALAAAVSAAPTGWLCVCSEADAFAAASFGRLTGEEDDY